jgi:lysylphosphatidylglycerol synthetase-like protein (DUF2156 family)
VAPLRIDPWKPVKGLVDGWLEGRAGAVRPDLGQAERLAFMRRHGDFSLAYATTKPMGAKDRIVTRAFATDRGYIAYGEKMGYVFALGDPVAAPDDRPALLDSFVQTFGDPSFVQVSAATAAALAAKGYRTTPFGVDTVLRLKEYTFDGKAKDGIRYASNWLRKRGFRIAEEPWSEATPAMLAAISAEWRASRVARRREMQFLNRGMPEGEETDVRIFVLRDSAGAPVACILFDPLHRDGRLVGYVTALKRRLDAAGVYAELGLTRHAIETFQREGLEEVRLGLSPLAPSEALGERPHQLLGFAFRRLYESDALNRRIFNFKGQAQFKKRFHGHEEPLFVAIRKGSAALQVLALVRLSKLI